MSIIDLSCGGGPVPVLHELFPHYAKAARGEMDCFYCYLPLSSPVVQWSGASGEILLHPGCVVELTIRLFRDVHEIECRSHLYVTARTTLDLRERLMREEQRP